MKLQPILPEDRETLPPPDDTPVPAKLSPIDALTLRVDAIFESQQQIAKQLGEIHTILIGQPGSLAKLIAEEVANRLLQSYQNEIRDLHERVSVLEDGQNESNGSPAGALG